MVFDTRSGVQSTLFCDLAAGDFSNPNVQCRWREASRQADPA
jgi:hypothetical protein